ncbi:MAG TPA: hypothetical protein VK922_05810 [Gemmatimonadaceae bacterium]|nr:hypothetical protein [Gemmatimonadaceae bacterium]
MHPQQPDAHRARLPDERLRELGAIARSYLAEQVTDAELERVVTSVSRDARACGMKAEELIVTCKEVWHSLPSDGLATERSTRARKLERMVKICIEGYFADR